MGLRGPPPTPTAVRQLQGNPGRRPLNAAEPSTPPLSVNPPEWMDDDADLKEFYFAVGNIVRAMNVAQESDGPALEMLSMCLAQARDAYRVVQRNGSTQFGQGGEQVSAHFKVMTQMIRQAMAIMKEFGMTPASRSRVKAMAMPEKKSKLAAFMGDGE
jgi:P27 family predicted phage terminase small subunit